MRKLITTHGNVRGAQGVFYRFGIYEASSGPRDSGGAIYRGDTAFGIHKGVGGERKIFTPMHNVTALYGTRVVTAP